MNTINGNQRSNYHRKFSFNHFFKSFMGSVFGSLKSCSNHQKNKPPIIKAKIKMKTMNNKSPNPIIMNIGNIIKAIIHHHLRNLKMELKGLKPSPNIPPITNRRTPTKTSIGNKVRNVFASSVSVPSKLLILLLFVIVSAIVFYHLSFSPFFLLYIFAIKHLRGYQQQMQVSIPGLDKYPTLFAFPFSHYSIGLKIGKPLLPIGI